MESTNPLKRTIGFFVPHRTIPHTSWAAANRWDLSILRLAILLSGLSIFGVGEAFLIQSNLGNSPWTVLAQGFSLHSPLSIGESTFLISSIVLCIWLPLGERPGFGTLANMVVIATSLQIGVSFIPSVKNNTILSIAMILIGIGAVGIGSAFYITCALGPGPRDGLMTALHKRTGIRVGRVRLLIELLALLCGIALGGSAGIGTALFALLIGNSVAIAFSMVHKINTYANR
jgi:uncharacterized membrane protein YczE